MASLRFSLMLLLISFSLGLNAQVTPNYWSQQYGSHGLLMNGSIIASVHDETAIYYNPGAMALNDEFGISLSLLTPSFSSLRTTDFLGDGTSSLDRGLGLAPGLVSATFQPFGTKSISMGITSLRRLESDLKYDDRVLSQVNSAENQVFIGDLFFRNQIKETWLGLGLSFRLADNLALGATHFATFRSEELKLDFKKEIFDAINSNAIIASWRSDLEYGYSTVGSMRTKFGLSWKPLGVKVGITYTSEDYGMVESSANYAFDDQKIFEDKSTEASSNDQDLSSVNEYKTPWSLGLGFEFELSSKTSLSLAAEYFNEIGRFEVINNTDDRFNGLTQNPEVTNFVVAQQKERVINVSVGMERRINERYTWFYGFRTDFSPNGLLDFGDGVAFLASTPNIFHISTGGAYAYRKSHFSVGIDYGYGVQSGGEQLTDISNITTDNIFTFDGDAVVKTFIHQVSLYIIYDL